MTFMRLRDRRSQEEDREERGESCVASPVANGEAPKEVRLGPGNVARRCSACHGTGGRGERYDCGRCSGNGFTGIDTSRPLENDTDPWARVIWWSEYYRETLGISRQATLFDDADLDDEPEGPSLFDLIAGHTTPCL